MARLLKNIYHELNDIVNSLYVKFEPSRHVAEA